MADGKPDLLRVLQHYQVDVNEHRQSQLVCCPVHEEDRPSCSVSLAKGLWSCKACGAQGDSFSLIKIKEGFDSFAAVVQFSETKLGFVSPVQTGGGRVGLSGSTGSSRGGYRPATRRGSRKPLQP